MSLKSIIIELAAEGAIKINDADQEAYVTFLINKAAKELYDNYDLIGSLREQVMDVDVAENTNQISLPSYVGQLRAVRYYQPNVQINLVDMRPRYQARFWQNKNALGWRLKEKMALARDVSNAGPLTITFLMPLEKDLQVTVTGRTPYANHHSETLSFAAGETSQTTSQSYEQIESINKNEACLYDAVITDIDNQEMGRLYNGDLATQYQMVSIFNSPNAATSLIPVSQYVEVLWKLRFQPFVNMQDEFLNGIYDQAIIWKYHEHQFLKLPTDTASALAMNVKCKEQIRKLADDVEQVQEKIMNLAPSPYLGAFDSIGQYSRYARFGGSYNSW